MFDVDVVVAGQCFGFCVATGTWLLTITLYTDRLANSDSLGFKSLLKAARGQRRVDAKICGNLLTLALAFLQFWQAFLVADLRTLCRLECAVETPSALSLGCFWCEL
jgi:hypothetical protein